MPHLQLKQKDRKISDLIFNDSFNQNNFSSLLISRNQGVSRLLFGEMKDADKDKVPNWIDCAPFDPKRHGQPAIPQSLQPQVQRQQIRQTLKKPPTIAEEKLIREYGSLEAAEKSKQIKETEEQIQKVIKKLQQGEITSKGGIPPELRQYINIPTGYFEYQQNKESYKNTLNELKREYEEAQKRYLNKPSGGYDANESIYRQFWNTKARYDEFQKVYSKLDEANAFSQYSVGNVLSDVNKYARSYEKYRDDQKDARARKEKLVSVLGSEKYRELEKGNLDIGNLTSKQVSELEKLRIIKKESVPVTDPFAGTYINPKTGQGFSMAPELAKEEGLISYTEYQSLSPQQKFYGKLGLDIYPQQKLYEKLGYSKSEAKVLAEKLIKQDKLVTSETKRYKDLGYKSADAKVLAEASAEKGGVTFTPEAAERVIKEKTIEKLQGKTQDYEQISQSNFRNRFTSFGLVSGSSLSVGQSSGLDGGSQFRDTTGGFFSNLFSLFQKGRQEQKETYSPTLGMFVGASSTGTGATGDLRFPTPTEQEEMETLTPFQQDIFGVRKRSQSVLLAEPGKLEAKRKQVEKVNEITTELNTLYNELVDKGKIDTSKNQFTDKATDKEIEKYQSLYTKLEREKGRLGERKVYVGLGGFGEKKDITEVSTGIGLFPQLSGTVVGKLLEPLGKEGGWFSIPEREVKYYEPQFGTIQRDLITGEPTITKEKKVTAPKITIGTPSQFKTAGEVGGTIGFYAIPYIGTGVFSYEVGKGLADANFNPIEFARRNPIEVVSLITLGTLKGKVIFNKHLLNERIKELQSVKWSVTSREVSRKGNKVLLRVSASKTTTKAAAEAEILVPIKQLENGRFIIETGEGGYVVRIKNPAFLGRDVLREAQRFTTAGRGTGKAEISVNTDYGKVFFDLDELNLYAGYGTGYVAPTGKDYIIPTRFGSLSAKTEEGTQLVGGELSKLKLKLSKFIGESEATGVFKITQKGEFLEETAGDLVSGRFKKMRGGKKTPLEETFEEKPQIQFQKQTGKLDEIIESFGKSAIGKIEKVAAKELKGATKTGKAGLELVKAGRVGLKEKQKASNLLVQKPLEVQRVKEKPAVKTSQKPASVLKTNLAQKQFVNPLQTQYPRQTGVEDVAQKTSQKQKIEQIGEEIGVSVAPKPKPKPKIIPFISLPGEVKVSKEQGYYAQVLRDATNPKKRRWETLNPNQPLTKNSALSLSAKEVDNTISARGRIVKAEEKIQMVKDKTGKLIKKKIQPQVLDTGNKYYQQNRDQFRNYRIQKGKKINLNNEFIERAEHRLDNPREVSRIQKAKQQANTIWGGNKNKKRKITI